METKALAAYQAPSMLVGLVLMWGCSGGSDTSQNSGETADPPGISQTAVSQSARTFSTSDTEESTDGRYAQRSVSQPRVRLNTSAGEIVIALDPQKAPGTVKNFLDYVEQGFYRDTVFHHVEPDKMVVGGAFAADGSEKPTQTPIRNEAHNGLKHERGTVAMARNPEAIDSATSQFFFNLSEAPHLNHAGETADEYGYCVFGRIEKGIDVAEQIATAPAEARVQTAESVNVPHTAARIISAEVLRQ